MTEKVYTLTDDEKAKINTALYALTRFNKYVSNLEPLKPSLRIELASTARKIFDDCFTASSSIFLKHLNTDSNEKASSVMHAVISYRENEFDNEFKELSKNLAKLDIVVNEIEDYLETLIDPS